MERIPVQSSHIAEIGYDPATGTLEVMFGDSSIYRYFLVPSFVAEGLFAATSKGKYFGEHISRRGHAPYRSEKVQ